MSKKKTWEQVVTPQPEPDPEDKAETPEEKAARLDREDALTLASIPKVNGVPIPEHVNLTREQLENNPSDYHPPGEDVPIPVREEEDTFVEHHVTVVDPRPQPNPSVMVPEPQPVAEIDDRQQWLCLQDDGIRTRHPAFRSSAHLIDHMVACPVCGNTHVRMVQPGEDVNDFALLDWQAQRDRERERLALPRR